MSRSAAAPTSGVRNGQMAKFADIVFGEDFWGTCLIRQGYAYKVME